MQLGRTERNDKQCPLYIIISLFCSINITMKFNGNYDTFTQNMDNFKQEIKNSLVNKYSGTVGLHEAQITLVLVTRGSIIITVIIGDDSSLPNSANVTLLLVQMQQDVSDSS